MEALLYGSAPPVPTITSSKNTKGKSKKAKAIKSKTVDEPITPAPAPAPETVVGVVEDDGDGQKTKKKKKKRTRGEGENGTVENGTERKSKKTKKSDKDKVVDNSLLTNENVNAESESGTAIAEGEKTKKQKKKSTTTAPAEASQPAPSPSTPAPTPSQKGTQLRSISATPTPTTTSTPSKAKKAANKTKTPTASSSTSTSTSASQDKAKPGRKPLPKDDDDTLRRKLSVPGAVEAMLASNFVRINELRRLEAAGILTYKKGKFTPEEREIVRKHLDDLSKVNKLDKEGLSEVILMTHKDRQKAGEYGNLWPDLGELLPGRPLKYIKDFVHREYDVLAHKGKWTKEQDDELIRMNELYPRQWSRMGVALERTADDCKHRFMKELNDRDTRETGRWTEDEEERLIKCVRSVHRQLGKEELATEAPWLTVGKMMKGSRSGHQCRKKWQHDLVHREQKKALRVRRTDRSWLIRRLKELGYTSESEIKWEAVHRKGWDVLSTTQLKDAWEKMKRSVDRYNVQKLSLSDTLEPLLKKYDSPSISKAFIDSDDEAEAEDEGDTESTSK